MSPPPADHVSAPSRPAAWIALSALLALLLVAAVITIVVLVRDDEAEPGPQGAGQYDFAQATCEIVATMPDSIGAHGLALDKPLLWRLQALAFNAIAAGHVDERHADYRTTGERLQSAMSRTEPEDVLKVIDDLRELCP